MTSSSNRNLQTIPFEPTGKWMMQRLARIVAFGFGSGLLRPAPGTWGTLVGWVLWFLVIGHAAWWGIGLVLVLGFAYGVWACDTVGAEMGHPDHGGMVWDEIIAFWLVLALIPADIFAQAFAFVLFRFFDVAKPPPIKDLERRCKGGLGVMVDDLGAAAYALLVFWIVAGLFW